MAAPLDQPYRGPGGRPSGRRPVSARPDAAPARRSAAEALALRLVLESHAHLLRRPGERGPAGPGVLGRVGPRREAILAAHELRAP